MPLHNHTVHDDKARTPAAYDTEVGWMASILAPATIDEPTPTTLAIALDDSLCLAFEPDEIVSSFRQQVLRAWIEARGSCPDEIAGHA